MVLRNGLYPFLLLPKTTGYSRLMRTSQSLLKGEHFSLREASSSANNYRNSYLQAGISLNRTGLLSNNRSFRHISLNSVIFNSRNWLLNNQSNDYTIHHNSNKIMLNHQITRLFSSSRNFKVNYEFEYYKDFMYYKLFNKILKAMFNTKLKIKANNSEEFFHEIEKLNSGIKKRIITAIENDEKNLKKRLNYFITELKNNPSKNYKNYNYIPFNKELDLIGSDIYQLGKGYNILNFFQENEAKASRISSIIERLNLLTLNKLRFLLHNENINSDRRLLASLDENDTLYQMNFTLKDKTNSTLNWAFISIYIKVSFEDLSEQIRDISYINCFLNSPDQMNKSRSVNSTAFFTSRSATRASTSRLPLPYNPNASKILCSIYESKTISPIVGVCFLNFATSELILSNIQDSQTYVRTIHKLNIYQPTEILVPINYLSSIESAANTTNTTNTTLSNTSTVTTNILTNVEKNDQNQSKIIKIIQSIINTGNCKITGINSKLFNPSTGLEQIKKYAYEKDFTKLFNELTDKPILLASVNSIIQYMKNSSTCQILFGNLRISYKACESTLLIDSKTIKSLELVNNSIDNKHGISLLKFLNSTVTKMGYRVLRNNILQPLTNPESIKLRLESVRELLMDNDMLSEVRSILKNSQDLDRLFSCLIISSKKQIQSRSISDQNINNIILLKHALNISLNISHSLKDVHSILLLEIKEICSHPDLISVKNLINDSINEDCSWSNTPLDLKNQKCYAVKGGKNGLLDVQRQIYKNIIDDIILLIEGIAEEHQLILDHKFDSTRGFYITIKKSQIIDTNKLPDIFINRIYKKNFIECTTLDIIKCNSRLNDTLSEIILMSDHIINELTEKCKSYISTMFMVSEALAILDLLCCFAYNAKTATNCYTCPEIFDKLVLKSSRHPILETTLNHDYISNDTYSTRDTSRVHILTGANMSGKSVYLRQMALLVVMAQIGSFIPADYAMFPIFHKLNARICTDTLTDINTSSFTQEMNEIAYIIEEANYKSLVIIDELGRGSSIVDGLSISVAITEYLVDIGPTVFLSTHFHDLPVILRNKPGVVQLHMSVDIKGSEFDMHYKVVTGESKLKNYGMKFVQNLGLFPLSVIRHSFEISKRLESTKFLSHNNRLDLTAKNRKVMLDLCQSLRHLNHEYDHEYDHQSNPQGFYNSLKQVQQTFIKQISCTERSLEVSVNKDEELDKATGERTLIVMSTRRKLCPSFDDCQVDSTYVKNTSSDNKGADDIPSNAFGINDLNQRIELIGSNVLSGSLLYKGLKIIFQSSAKDDLFVDDGDVLKPFNSKFTDKKINKFL
ncbi:MutS family protein MSH4 ASCRUDRAFT_7366 [Ascoidea rubescens DSM 1968]|uniref:DNA mismatch repair protein MSH3 n=1 Tax=Ascoidea rubescens DSM 1968 TaxID=1344418 RepID=A0A1D2VJV5_9ASCO|nr:hypothetical protein ASCRUDRAFT_7366 [Ascoidea rubescens DSM 1968]ODV61901.1 hypothetical protein ASCRUDRAFT_7366 [Ascoidea rubescens DSM 1968]